MSGSVGWHRRATRGEMPPSRDLLVNVPTSSVADAPYFEQQAVRFGAGDTGRNLGVVKTEIPTNSVADLQMSRQGYILLKDEFA